MKREMRLPLAAALLGVCASSLGCAAELDVAGGRKEGPLTYPEDASAGSNDATPPEREVVTWKACDNTGVMFDEARTGDRCSFTGPCGDTDGCKFRSASCANGVLRMTEAEACEDAKPNVPGDCGRVLDDACCIVLEECGTDSVHARVCSADCEQLEANAGVSVLQNCQALAQRLVLGGLPGAGVFGAPCEGNFICDSEGRNLAQGDGYLDSYGTLYWCGAGVLQWAVTGPQFLSEL